MVSHEIISSMLSQSAVRKFILLEVRQVTDRGDRVAGKNNFSLLLPGDSNVVYIYNCFLQAPENT